jgi:hypothetical protein
MTPRGLALAVGLLTPAAWLLWAEHLAGGWRTVLATAGLWWLAALRATWPVWLPAAVALLALWLALPPRPPRRRDAQEPAEAAPAAPAGVAADGRLDLADMARLSPAEWRALSRTPEGAAALAAEREAARGAGARPFAPAEAAGGAGGEDPALAPGVEAAAGDGEGGGEDEREPKGQDPTQDPPRVVGPASGPAPPRTVWEAFALLDQEDEEDEGDDDAA